MSQFEEGYKGHLGACERRTHLGRHAGLGQLLGRKIEGPETEAGK